MRPLTAWMVTIGRIAYAFGYEVRPFWRRLLRRASIRREIEAERERKVGRG